MGFGEGRSVKKYKFTVIDIGFLVGKQPRTIQEHIKQRKFDPNRLGSVVDYLLKYRRWDSKGNIIRN